MSKDGDVINCDFCGADNNHADYLLEGTANNNAHICNECVEMGMVIIIEQRIPRLQKKERPTDDRR